MEAAEDTSLQPAIGWLAQTILATLQIEQLDAWIHRAGLAHDTERLRSEVERVDMVVAAVGGRATGNRPLSRSLARIKELLYDADDVVDELDYYRLQQQVLRVASDDPRSTHGAERGDQGSRGNAPAADAPTRSNGNLRSKHWNDFTVTRWEDGKAVEAKCIHCGAQPIKCRSSNGTSVLSNHLKSKGCIRKRGEPSNPSSTNVATETETPIAVGDSSSRKRRRADDESAQITAANTHASWDKAELSDRIQEITIQLQDIRTTVSEVLNLHGPNSASSSYHHQSTTSYQHLKTSSLLPGKVFGRSAEKNSIVKLITENKSDGVTVLPIVGIAGIGKTALTQLVYNDPNVESQFNLRIWIWVSHNFDEVRLTREMLDFVSQDRHEGSHKKNERHDRISSFGKLQEVLREHMEFQSKRFLLILDDVWDNLDNYQWNRVFAPLISSDVKGNVILITTRNLSVAQKIGTLEPVKLDALANNDFWLLFKYLAFGDENYEGHQSLCIVGRQIAEGLKGNPLAVETAGTLLREHLTVDHWSSILMNEKWKSMQLSRGIMPALKLSYDQLPYHLQQCFSFSSIIPDSHEFPGVDLVRFWISQGFVKCNHSTQRLEEIGQHYLTDLVNLGFFQEVGNQACYATCGLMHDFARMVSRTECASIDNLQCNEMLPTIRHLSIVADSADTEDRHGNTTRFEKFKEILRNRAAPVRKLRTLVLIGQHDSLFFRCLVDIFLKAQNLRLLQMPETSADISTIMCSCVIPTHLRYLKFQVDQEDSVVPPVSTKFYHLQVLDFGSDLSGIVLDDLNNLVSLRHLVAEEEMHSSIARIGTMTSLQELHDFRVDSSDGFDIRQLQYMNELVQLGVSQLEKVATMHEAYGARLRNKQHLEKLHLSWNDASSLVECDNGTSSEPSRNIEREVLEGLEPHLDLKHLRISGYSSMTFPTWLAGNISVTALQTLRLECFGELQILPSLERLPYLTKLNLSNMLRVAEVLVPSLVELVLIDMPMLERCVCTCVGDLKSTLNVLEINRCHALKVFNLFESCHKVEIEQKSRLPCLRKLIIHDCPNLQVVNPLPPSATFSEGLEPHLDLKHLRISGYSSMTFRTWLAGNISVTALQTLHLEYFGELQILPSLERLPFLTKLNLSNMSRVVEVLVPSLVELVLIDMPMLERCVCTCVGDLKSTLSVLEIKRCRALKVFNLFESCHKVEIEQKSQLPCLRKLIIHDCPNLQVVNPLPPSATFSELCISGVSALPTIQGSTSTLPDIEELSCRRLIIGVRKFLYSLEQSSYDEFSDKLLTLDHKILAFHNLRFLNVLVIACYPNLASISFKGLSQLASLKSLSVENCRKLFSSHILPEHTDEDIAAANCNALPSLKSFCLQSCGISGKWLSVIMQRYAPALEEFCISDCPQITQFSIEEGKNSESDLISAPEAPSSGCPDETLTSSAPDGLLHIQLSLSSSLKIVSIIGCHLTFNVGEEGLSRFTSLEMLRILESPELLSSLVHKDRGDDHADLRWLLPQSLAELYIRGYPRETLRLCFPKNRTCLRTLTVDGAVHCGRGRSCLEYLNLQACTVLDALTIRDCESLAALEGLHSLRNLQLDRCPSLPPGLEHLSWQGYEICPRLERFRIDDYSFLTRSFCKQLTSLQRLDLGSVKSKATKLTDEQERALRHLVSLQVLEFAICRELVDLPAGLHSLPSLESLAIRYCPGILSLPEKGLPPSLEELEIYNCSKELTDQCRMLATSELTVRFNYLN